MEFFTPKLRSILAWSVEFNQKFMVARSFRSKTPGYFGFECRLHSERAPDEGDQMQHRSILQTAMKKTRGKRPEVNVILNDQDSYYLVIFANVICCQITPVIIYRYLHYMVIASKSTSVTSVRGLKSVSSMTYVTILLSKNIFVSRHDKQESLTYMALLQEITNCSHRQSEIKEVHIANDLAVYSIGKPNNFS